MTAADIPASVWDQIPVLLAFMAFLIVVGKYFVDFLSKREQEAADQAARRDKEWRDFFSALRTIDNETMSKMTVVMERLISRVESLEGKFDAHDAKEMEILRIMSDRERKTTPRKQE